MNRSRSHLEGVLILVTLLLMGCSSSSARMRMTVLLRPGLSPSEIAKVTLTVSAPGEESVTENLSRASNQWTGSFEGLAAGTARTIQAIALDGSGNELYRGQATDVTLEDEEKTLVLITLDEPMPPEATEPEAPILASLTAYPAEVRAGGTVALSATVTDRNAEDIIQVEWTAPAGSFSNAEGGRVTWTAPASASTFSLGCTAIDSQGLSSSASIPLTVSATSTSSSNAGSGKTCCKHCGSGSKPCGDSCIKSSYTCSKPSGCACY